MSKSGFNGKKLKRLRELRGLTQDDLVRKLNDLLVTDTIEDRSVRMWENQNRKPRPKRLLCLAAILDCETEDFFDNIDVSGMSKEGRKSVKSPNSALNKYLRDFSGFIDERTAAFVGRDFVFDAIDEFVSTNDRGYFFIKGDPGIGKSAIACELVRRSGFIHHFNIRAEGRNTPRQFMENVCSQLILEYGLDYEDLPSEKLQDGELLQVLLQEVSDKIKASESVVIVIDALDEVDTAGVGGANLLYLPVNLPKKIYILATTRPQQLNLRIGCIQGDCTIGPKSDENLEDIGEYLRAKVREQKIASYITKQKMTSKRFIEHMKQKSEGNFMYLHYVLPEITSGAYRDLKLNCLPAGLQNYYEDHWRRMRMADSPLPKEKIKAIYVLSEVKEPVSAELLADFCGEDVLIVQAVLIGWRQFLHEKKVEGQTRYSIYHGSFREFLNRREIIQAAKITVKDIHQLIAGTLYTELLQDEQAQ